MLKKGDMWNLAHFQGSSPWSCGLPVSRRDTIRANSRALIPKTTCHWFRRLMLRQPCRPCAAGGWNLRLPTPVPDRRVPILAQGFEHVNVLRFRNYSCRQGMGPGINFTDPDVKCCLEAECPVGGIW